jgi:hypothetical protein
MGYWRQAQLMAAIVSSDIFANVASAGRGIRALNDDGVGAGKCDGMREIPLG